MGTRVLPECKWWVSRRGDELAFAFDWNDPTLHGLRHGSASQPTPLRNKGVMWPYKGKPMIVALDKAYLWRRYVWGGVDQP